MAPIGWPRALRPPEGLTGRAPSKRVVPSRITFQPSPGAARPIASYSIISAMVKQSWVSTMSRSVTATPAASSAPAQARRGPSKAVGSRRESARKSLTWRAGAEGDGALEAGRGLGVGEHQRRRAVGDEAAVGAAQRAGDVGVLVGDGVAELEAEVLLQVGVGVAGAVRVVLGGDHRELGRAVAVALEVGVRRSARRCRRSRPRRRPPRRGSRRSAARRRPPPSGSPSSSRRRRPARPCRGRRR